jgi:hypothetical protein
LKAAEKAAQAGGSGEAKRTVTVPES